MSNSTFLQKMRKGDLAKMAESLSLEYALTHPFHSTSHFHLTFIHPTCPRLHRASSLTRTSIEGLKKSQLETLIEAELTAHSHYAADSRYAGYYKRRLTDISSPIKREAEAVRDGVVDAVNAVATSKPARTARRRVKEPVEEAGSAL